MEKQLNSYGNMLQAMQQHFYQHGLKLTINDRLKRLRKLKSWVLKHEDEILAALYKDLQKSKVEAYLSEIKVIVNEIDDAVSNLDVWSSDEYKPAPLALFGTSAHVKKEPKGVCLILAPWNFPFNLTIGPLVSCLAAGNYAVVKPSEFTPATSALMHQLVSACFDSNEVFVLEGDALVAAALSALPFDHIFFTGSPAVGKLVMKAAAENLTPITLELGGQNPLIIDASANLKLTAERIVWGKFMNAGQSCVSINLIYCHAVVYSSFLLELKDAFKRLFPTENLDRDLTCIVSTKHYQRLETLVADALEKGGKLLIDAPNTPSVNRFGPKVLVDVQPHSQILSEEIFGSILPILKYDDIQTVYASIRLKPKPLAAYLFTTKSKAKAEFLREVSAGTCAINDTTLQFSHQHLPFGGNGFSGIGKAHGYYGYLEFSNQKAILIQSNMFASIKLLYPPYTPLKEKLARFLARYF